MINHVFFSASGFTDKPHKIEFIGYQVQLLPRCSMVLEYVPTKLGQICVVQVNLPAPWSNNSWRLLSGNPIRHRSCLDDQNPPKKSMAYFQGDHLHGQSRAHVFFHR